MWAGETLRGGNSEEERHPLEKVRMQKRLAFKEVLPQGDGTVGSKKEKDWHIDYKSLIERGVKLKVAGQEDSELHEKNTRLTFEKMWKQKKKGNLRNKRRNRAEEEGKKVAGVEGRIFARSPTRGWRVNHLFLH